MKLLPMLVIPVVLCIPASLSKAQDSISGQNGAHISFNTLVHDFGEILKGEIVSFEFQFQNTGNRPLVISNVLTSCGCAASDWPEGLISPGSGGLIRVTFDSEGKSGRQKKIITVVSNAFNNRKELSIEAFVLPNRSDF